MCRGSEWICKGSLLNMCTSFYSIEACLFLVCPHSKTSTIYKVFLSWQAMGSNFCLLITGWLTNSLCSFFCTFLGLVFCLISLESCFVHSHLVICRVLKIEIHITALFFSSAFQPFFYLLKAYSLPFKNIFRERVSLKSVFSL